MNNIQSNRNNDAEAAGRILTDFIYDHTVKGEDFFLVKLRVMRLSTSYDDIPLIIPERIVDNLQSLEGEYVKVRGEFRSMNKMIGQQNRLILRLFVKELIKYDGSMVNFPNHIGLDGFVCKKPVYRTTPGGREITDIMLAVHRGYGKTDYIPCILWGRNARFARRIPVGTRLRLSGRLQSRIYHKKTEQNEIITREICEISVNTMECVASEQETGYEVAESQDM